MQPMDSPVDPILDELHATRRKLLEQHGGVAGLAAFLRQQEATSAHLVIDAPSENRGSDSTHQSENKSDQ